MELNEEYSINKGNNQLYFFKIITDSVKLLFTFDGTYYHFVRASSPISEIDLSLNLQELYSFIAKRLKVTTDNFMVQILDGIHIDTLRKADMVLIPYEKENLRENISVNPTSSGEVFFYHFCQLALPLLFPTNNQLKTIFSKTYENLQIPLLKLLDTLTDEEKISFIDLLQNLNEKNLNEKLKPDPKAEKKIKHFLAIFKHSKNLPEIINEVILELKISSMTLKEAEIIPSISPTHAIEQVFCHFFHIILQISAATFPQIGEELSRLLINALNADNETLVLTATETTQLLSELDKERCTVLENQLTKIQEATEDTADAMLTNLKFDTEPEDKKEFLKTFGDCLNYLHQSSQQKEAKKVLEAMLTGNVQFFNRTEEDFTSTPTTLRNFYEPIP